MNSNERWWEFNNEENCEYCAICGKRGDLILCEGNCKRSFHLKCIGLKEIPDGEWICDDCKSGKKVKHKSSYFDYNPYEDKDIYDDNPINSEESICRGLCYLFKLYDNDKTEYISQNLLLFLSSYSASTTGKVRDLSIKNISIIKYAFESSCTIDTLSGNLNYLKILEYLKETYICERLFINPKEKTYLLEAFCKRVNISDLLGFNPKSDEKFPISAFKICDCGRRVIKPNCDNCGKKDVETINWLELYTFAIKYSYYIDYLGLYSEPLLYLTLKHLNQYMPYIN